MQKRETDTREREQTFRKRRTERRVRDGGRSAGEIEPESGNVGRRRGRQVPGSPGRHAMLRHTSPESGAQKQVRGFLKMPRVQNFI